MLGFLRIMHTRWIDLGSAWPPTTNYQPISSLEFQTWAYGNDAVIGKQPSSGVELSRVRGCHSPGILIFLMAASTVRILISQYDDRGIRVPVAGGWGGAV